MDSTLMELYSVILCINRPDGVKGHEVYGTIRAQDAGGIIEFFNQEKDKPTYIGSDGNLPLTGPYRCIVGPNFDLCLNLREKHNDLEIGHGYLSFPFDVELSFYGTRACYVIHGKDGCAILHFTMFSRSVQAEVDVKLTFDAERSNMSGIYGTLFARNRETDDWYANKYYQTALFDMPQDKAILLERGNEDIPLSRCVVVVPGYSSLVIQADLWDKCLSEAGVRVASGSVTFKPKPSGTSSQYIGGPNGCIKVNVSWLDDPFRSPAMASFWKMIEEDKRRIEEERRLNDKRRLEAKRRLDT